MELHNEIKTLNTIINVQNEIISKLRYVQGQTQLVSDLESSIIELAILRKSLIAKVN